MTIPEEIIKQQAEMIIYLDNTLDSMSMWMLIVSIFFFLFGVGLGHYIGRIKDEEIENNKTRPKFSYPPAGQNPEKNVDEYRKDVYRLVDELNIKLSAKLNKPTKEK